MPLLLAALLGLAALLIVLAPLFVPAPAADADPADPAALPALAERERAAKAALRDVELDYQLGNLDGDDYQALRDRYTRRALGALKGRYDRERALDDAIEERVRALRAVAPAVRGNGHGRIHKEDTEVGAPTGGITEDSEGRGVRAVVQSTKVPTRETAGKPERRPRRGAQPRQGGGNGAQGRHGKHGRGKA